MTLKQLRERLSADSYSSKGGVFTVRHEFFYTNGLSAESFVAEVLRACPDAKVLDSGEVWKSFHGSASTANSSHWFVKFTVQA